MKQRAARAWWNTPLVAGSSAAASVLSLLLFPVVTRLYDPAAVGGYGLFIATVSLVGAVLSLRLDLAALACPHDEGGDAQARQLCRLAVLVSFAGAVVVALITILWVTLSASRPELTLVALGSLGTALVSLQVTVDSRQRRYGVIAGLSVARVVVFVLAAVAARSMNDSAFALCLAAVVATVPSSVYALWSVPLRGGAASARELLHRYWRFPAFQAPAAVLNSAPMLLLTLWVDRAAGAVVLGFVVAASRIQTAPVTALTSSVASVFTTDVVASIDDRQHVRGLYRRTLATSVGLVAIFGGLTVAFASLLELLLGPQWTGLRPYLLALLPWALAFMIVAIPTALLGVVGEQRRVFTSRWLLMAGLAAGFLVAGVLCDPGPTMVGVAAVIFLVVAVAFAAVTYAGLGAGAAERVDSGKAGL